MFTGCYMYMQHSNQLTLAQFRNLQRQLRCARMDDNCHRMWHIQAILVPDQFWDGSTWRNIQKTKGGEYCGL